MDTPVWDAVWSYVVPLSLLLLQCDMRKIRRESRRILIVFLIGSVGTTCGALIGFAALHNVIPELSGITGSFTGTYIGGSANFAALSTAFDVSGEMMSAAVVADNLLMILYFFVLITIPSIGFFYKKYSHPYVDEIEAAGANTNGDTQAATAFTTAALSNTIAGAFGSVIPTSNTVLSILNTLLGNQYL